jgi:HAE1 family hydrophobic/amphiphilic exporter-1
MTNYLENNVVNDIKRVTGVSNVLVFGERKYAMRLWIDPKRLADNGLSAGDVVTALEAQNVQVAAGSIGAPPTNGNQPYEYGVRATGRLHTTSDFANIVLRSTPDGGFVKVSDVGRVTLGAENYSGSLWFDGREGIGLGVLQLQSGNALQVSSQVRQTLDRLQAKFPAGMSYHVAFDTTEFVRESIKEVVITLIIAIALVVLVIFLFLQDWRTTLIPALTIPVSLVGTFFLMNVLGFSINQLTLFGLTLATGLVVDDAIVVIENIARFIQEKKMPPLDGAREAMTEIQGAVVASSLVLLAVFIPVAFFPGTTGQLYKQFALTIACSIARCIASRASSGPSIARSMRRVAATRACCPPCSACAEPSSSRSPCSWPRRASRSRTIRPASSPTKIRASRSSSRRVRRACRSTTRTASRARSKRSSSSSPRSPTSSMRAVSASPATARTTRRCSSGSPIGASAPGRRTRSTR